MRRMPFPEIEDQRWLLDVLRRSMQEDMGFAQRFCRMYHGSEKALDDLVENTGCCNFIDIGSGSAMPIIDLLLKTSKPVTFCLTDKYPNIKRFEEAKKRFPRNITFRKTPFTIEDLNEPGYIISCIDFIHHINKEELYTLIEKSASCKGIFIMESGKRSLLRALWFAPGAFFGSILNTIRNPSLQRVLLTIPLILPLSVAYDALATCLKRYNPDEIAEITRSVDMNLDYKFGSMPSGAFYFYAYKQSQEKIEK